MTHRIRLHFEHHGPYAPILRTYDVESVNDAERDLKAIASAMGAKLTAFTLDTGKQTFVFDPRRVVLIECEPLPSD